MTNQQIAEVLRKIDSERCHKRAAAIEREEHEFYGSLDLGYLELWDEDVRTILMSFEEIDHGDSSLLRSVHFNFNDLIGNYGATVLIEHLPQDLAELSLINCGIGDTGGRAILEWLERESRLNTLYIEQNKFSHEVKSEFQKFASKNQHLLIEF